MNEIVTQKEINKKQFRDGVAKFEERLSKVPGAKVGHEMDGELCPLKHAFCDGMYVREIFMPKGLVITSKIHKVKHPYFVMKGKCRVLTEKGILNIEAPFHGITEVGTKRVIQVLEDCVWITCHVTNETDLGKIEEQIIAKDFNDPALAHMNLQIEEGNNVQNVKE